MDLRYEMLYVQDVAHNIGGPEGDILVVIELIYINYYSVFCEKTNIIE